MNDNFSLKIFYLKEFQNFTGTLLRIIYFSFIFFLIKHPLDNLFAKVQLALYSFIQIFFIGKILTTLIKNRFHAFNSYMSLGVEEQFYLFLPLFLIALYKIYKNKINKYLVILILFH